MLEIVQMKNLENHKKTFMKFQMTISSKLKLAEKLYINTRLKKPLQKR